MPLKSDFLKSWRSKNGQQKSSDEKNGDPKRNPAKKKQGLNEILRMQGLMFNDSCNLMDPHEAI